MSRFFSFRKWFDRLLGPSPPNRRKAVANNRIRLTLEMLENRLPPAATFSIATANVIEPGPGGTANMDFTVTRSGDLSPQLTVGYTTVAGTAQANVDFTPVTGTTTFASGSATALIKIPVFGPNVYNHPNLTFSVQLDGIVSAGVTMAARTDFTAGTGPVSVAMSDLNGDGKLDMVVANSGDNTVSVLLNTTAPGATTPTFAAQQTFATGTDPVAVAIADFNHDGKPDLVVANNSAGTVSVLLNTTPTGATTFSFGPHMDFATGSKPTSVAAGDLNGDGNPDLVVADNGSNSVSVLLNTTAPGAITPTFAGHVDFTTGTAPYSVAIGDLNGDGKPDLAVANGGSNSVSVLFNTTAPGAAAPSFAAKQDFTTGAKPESVALGDLNGDGVLDLAVANATDNTVTLLLNGTAPGATIFSLAGKQDLQTGTTPQAVTIKDLDGDGRPDLVVANDGSGANTISVLVNVTVPGATTPRFAPQQTFTTGNGASAVAMGDINGDGEPDLVVADNGTGTNAVSVLLNTTVLTAVANTSTFPTTQINFNSKSESSVIGDINGDGKPDLILSPEFGAYSVSVLVNKTAPGATSPSFANAVNFATVLGPRFVTLGDINQDGKPDLIVIDNSSSSVSVFLNTTPPGAARPSFANAVSFAAGSNERAAVVADFNGDGKPDIAVVSYNGYASVLLNTTAPGAATPTFAASKSFPLGTGSLALAVADVNGDGKPDLLSANFSDGTASVLLNTTAPGANSVTFANQKTFGVGANPESIAVGDLNGDGKPDFAVANENSPATVLLNTTAAGAAIPSFSAATNITPNGGFWNVAIQDINGDGKPDVFLNNYFDGSEWVLVNTTPPGAAPTFTTQKITLLGRGANSLTLGDLNNDNMPEAVVTSQGNNTVAVLMNTPATVANATATAVLNETAQFSAASETVNENGGTFSVTVNLSLASPVDTMIPFTLGGTAVSGTNYKSVTPSPLVIPAGQTSATITGTLIDDGKFDINKTLTITLGTPTNAVLGSTPANTLTIQESDFAPIVAFAQATQSVAENGGTFSATVNLSAVYTSDVTIPFTLTGTAVSGTNYSGTTASPLVIPAGQTSGTITGTLLDDNKFDSVNKTLVLTLGTPTDGILGSTAADTITIQESDTAPTVALASAAQTVNEKDGTFSVTFNLSAASNVATTVPFALTGTAVSGANYSNVTPSPLVIAAGQTSGTITGKLIDDNKFDSINKTLILTLGTPTNAALGTISADTITIQESDPQPTVALASATQTVNENGGTFIVKVNLSAVSNAPTSISFTLSGTAVSGTNYTSVTASPLVIAAGQTSGTITGSLIDDGEFDPANKTLILTLGTPTNAVLGSTTADTITIQESDPKPTVSLAGANQTVGESSGTFSVTVNLSAASNVDTSVPFTLAGTAVSGTNYSGVTASPLVIAAGQTSGAITGTLIDDAQYDTVNKTLTVTLGAPTNAALGATAAGTLTIVESDPAPAIAFASAAEIVNGSAGTFSVTVNLSAPSNVATIIPFTLGGTAVAGADYSGVTASPLVIAAGQASGTITGTPINNPGPNPAKTLTFTLGAPTNGTLGAITTNTLTMIEPLVVGDQTLSYRQNSFAVSLPPTGTASFTIAGSMAYFLKRDLNLSVSPNGFFLNAAGMNEKWLLGNDNAFANPWYFIRPSGQVLAWDGTAAASGSAPVANLDPVYYTYLDLLTSATQATFDVVLQQRLGLTFAGGYFENYGGQHEKWLQGNRNPYGNPWYFIDTAGRFYAWDGTANQATGTLLANLDPLYWAQPARLFNAQPGAVTGAISGNVLTITTPSNWAGRAVVELNTTAPALRHEIFTLNFVNHPPVLTVTPSGNQTTTKGTPLSVTLAATDADGDSLTFSALGGHLGYALGQSLGLRPATATSNTNSQQFFGMAQSVTQANLFFNFGGQQEEWLQSALGGWYFIKPDGTFWKWDGTANQATGSQVAVLDPIYYYHPDLLYNAPAGDLAYALDQRLNLSNTGDLSLNYGHQNEKWLLGNDGWYFIKPNGQLWKWDGTLNQATGTLMATLDPDYYTDIQRLYNDPLPNQVAISVVGNKLTLTPAANFVGQFWIVVKVSDGSQAASHVFQLGVTA